MQMTSLEMPNILRAKVCVVGEPKVGKTSMCQQLTTDGTNFPKNYLMTHGAATLVKAINIPDTNDVVELYLVDCSGREIYLNTLEQLWKDSAMVVAMYDVCNEASFGVVAKWLEQVTRVVKDGDDKSERKLIGVLMANKSDLADRRVVPPKTGSDLAQQLGLMYFECSAKDYNGVEEPFFYLASEYHKVYEEKSDHIVNFG